MVAFGSGIQDIYVIEETRRNGVVVLWIFSSS
jgi:hypothetical protein